MISNILLILSLSFVDMLEYTQSQTGILFLFPLMLGIIGFHIGSRNSTANGIIVGSMSVFITTLLFTTILDNEYNRVMLPLTGVIIIISLGTLIYFNLQRK